MLECSKVKAMNMEIVCGEIFTTNKSKCQRRKEIVSGFKVMDDFFTKKKNKLLTGGIKRPKPV